MRVRSTLAASLLALALCACSPSAPAVAPTAPAIGPADPQTMAIVTAAQAYIASLTPAQAQASLFAYRDADQRDRWSNFPTGALERKGVKWGDLDPVQRARFTDLMNAMLSPEGVRILGDQMEADEYLRRSPDPGALGIDGLPPPPIGEPPVAGSVAPDAPAGPPRFGADLYYIAFLGSPSVTAPWMLQFGGHHLALNATVVGPNLTIAPSLTGGQPVSFEKGGKPIRIVEPEVKQAQALIDSLSPDQLDAALMRPSPIDLLMGPGRDGYTLRPEGLQASAMRPDQKAHLLALIETRVGIMNADDAAAAMAKVRKNIDQTWFAWFGPTNAAAEAYFRVTGPTVLMEFAPQGAPGVASNHVHSMYRDPSNDYGAAWAPIK